jgi:predicted RNA binding protein YcfA (HicA-like mRNA interferase family)
LAASDETVSHAGYKHNKPPITAVVVTYSSPILPHRIDGIIAHEFEELRADGDHAQVVKRAAKTELPISDEARRLNRARAL